MAAIVLNWNSWADTVACLESLAASNRAPDLIVICDNGSSDGSVEHLAVWAQQRGSFARFDTPEAALASTPRAASFVLIAIGENRGYAGGNNIGIRYAMMDGAADYVWILNNDAVVHHAALEHMLDTAASDSSIGMVGSKLLRYDEPDTIQVLGGGYVIPVLCHDTQLGSGLKSEQAPTAPIELDHLIGASLMVRTAAIRGVGLIDESYFLYREETDWCIRMRAAGWRLVCDAQATVWHKQSHSVGFKTPVHDYYAVRNMLYLVRKFYPVWLMPALAYFACRSIVPKLVRGEFARLIAVLQAFRDFAAGVRGRSPLHSEDVLVENYRRKSARTLSASSLPMASRAAPSAALRE